MQVINSIGGAGSGYPAQILRAYNTGVVYYRYFYPDNNVWINWVTFATESYVDNKIQGLYFNFCPLSTLVTQTGVSNTDSTYNFFNSSNLKPGFYFGTASGGLLKGMTTNTYNSYILFKAQTNFGKLFIMPTNGSTIYMLDAQKSDTWYTLHS